MLGGMWLIGERLKNYLNLQNKMGKLNSEELQSVILVRCSYLKTLEGMDDDYCVGYPQYIDHMKTLSQSRSKRFFEELGEELYYPFLWELKETYGLNRNSSYYHSKKTIKTLEKDIRYICDVEEGEDVYYNPKYMVLKVLVLSNMYSPQHVYPEVKKFLNEVG